MIYSEFSPESIFPTSDEALKEFSDNIWTPIIRHDCTFPTSIFQDVMANLIRNPNIQSNRLFRADISLESPFTQAIAYDSKISPQIYQLEGHVLKSVIVRTLIPRNATIDRSMDQTCLFYERTEGCNSTRSVVVYIPHISSPHDCPFYHPAVRAVAFLHEYDASSRLGKISIQYSFFAFEPRSAKLDRVAYHLLAILHKHGHGNLNGYVKRVNHDALLPQAVVQNTYARLKATYAKGLIDNWVEKTDPEKHVFEDLGIAAFLVELWAKMYADQDFPGFVDVGCGNGLLVHILLEEGYHGWGFDARRRRSWSNYSFNTQDRLKELVMIPALLQSNSGSKCLFQQKGGQNIESISGVTAQDASEFSSTIGISANGTRLLTSDDQIQVGVHNGNFPRGTFIISNHGDELTAWTPIIATLSESSFMMIPCCSHNLTGSRFRAPLSSKANVADTAYATLVAWVSKLAEDCGWEVEKEMLRIPSTRNAALIGRRRSKSFEGFNFLDLVEAYGGAQGWVENALKLTSRAIRAH